MKKIILALAVLMTTQFATAGNVTPVTKITNVFTYGDSAVIKIANKHGNEYECTYSKADEYLFLDLTSESSKTIYSAILSAFVSGSLARIAYNDCVDWGSTTLSNIYRVDMMK